MNRFSNGFGANKSPALGVSLARKCLGGRAVSLLAPLHGEDARSRLGEVRPSDARSRLGEVRPVHELHGEEPMNCLVRNP